MATLISDTFVEGSPPVTLIAHTISPTNTPSASWTYDVATTAFNVLVSGTANHNAQTGAAVDVVFCDAGVSDCTVQGDLTIASTTVWPALAFRVQDKNNFWMALIYDAAGGSISLYQVVSGSLNLASSVSLTFSVGTPYTIAAVLSGTSITIKVNGTTQITFTSGTGGTTTAFDTKTKHGLAGTGSFTGQLYNNFLVSTTGGSPPVADFTGTPTSGSATLSVAFTDSSTNTPTSWLWEKNDGSGWANFAGSPTTQNPTESFAAGTWSVRLTATNASGSDTKTRTNYITSSSGASVAPLAAYYGLLLKG